jgi:hypothetical protein
MRRTEIDLLGMLESVLAYLEKNMDLIKNNPMLMEAYNELKAHVEELKRLKEQQAVDAKPEYAIKGSNKKNLIATTKIILAALSTVAAVKNDEKLKALCSIQLSTLPDMRESNLVEFCRKVYNAALLVVADLEPWGVTREEIDELGEDCDTFLDHNSIIRNVEVSSALATDGISVNLGIAMDLLKNKLDLMLLTYNKQNPTFYSGYQMARQTVHHAATHTTKTKDTDTTITK